MAPNRANARYNSGLNPWRWQRRLAAALLAALVLSACGQTGSLYLPDEEEENAT